MKTNLPRCIAVVGLGYVGLPLASAFGKVVATIGFDVNEQRVRELRKGADRNGDMTKADLLTPRLEFTSDPSLLQRATVIIIAVPMNRLDYTFVARQPVNKPADLAGKKIGIGAVGGSDELATRIALEKLGVNPASVTMITAGGSAERLTSLRIGSVDAATVGGATFIGGGAGLHKVLDLVDLGVEFPFTAIFTTKKFAAANRDAVLGFIRSYMRGVRFFQENKEEAIAITARNLRTTNKDLLERQWLYVKDHVFEKVPIPTEKGFKLIFDMLSPRNPKVLALRMEDVYDGSYVKELVDKGFFK